MSKSRRVKTNPEVDALPWSDIQTVFSVDEFKSKFKQVPKDILVFVANKRNHIRVVASVLKSMKITDPDIPIVERAAVVADKMQYIAKELLQEENTK